ncbi:MAG: DUF3761 domain-containing protein [Aquirhabdus sp.]
MKALFASATLAVGLMASAGVFAKANEAAAPAGTPAGTTGMCNDGSMNMTPTKNGACQGHKGIKVWYTTGAAASVSAPAVAAKTTMPTTSTTATPATTPAAAPAKKGFASLFSKKTAAPAAGAAAVGTAAVATTATTAATTTTTAATTTKTTAPAVAATGGAGQVWVNTSSKVYHCQGSKYYGKTKAGQYMTEAAAQAAGAHGDHGKTCG